MIEPGFSSPSLNIHLVSLGCPKNLVDSEKTLYSLNLAGATLVDDPHEADILLVNTCGFVADAKEESIDVILEMVDIKNSRPSDVKLAVMGCLTQRYKEEIRKEIPEIDHFFGIDSLLDIAKTLAPNASVILPDPDAPGRIITTAPHWAYLKIAEGCSNTCSFCAIPSIRGPYVSRPMESVLVEARQLAASGVKEIIIVAQDSTLYGADLKIKGGLTTLLRNMELIDGIEWIRVMYLYPALVSDRLLDLFRSSPKVVPYFDMPLQHASDSILQLMKRPETEKSIRKLLETIRTSIDNAAIRTTFIVGFPQETGSDFKKLMALVDDIKFDHLGAFIYSPEEGTSAYNLSGVVPADVAEARFDELMSAQKDISAKILNDKVGSDATVMVDTFNEDEMLTTGRLATQAPKIDGAVILDDVEASVGDFVTVKVTGHTEYDLIAKRVSGE